MVSIVFGAANFNECSYMVELLWFAWTLNGIAGVYVLSTTGASTRTGRIADWQVYWLPGRGAAWLVGDTRGMDMGSIATVSNTYPVVYDNIHDFVKGVFDLAPYHAWCGYSMSTATCTDNNHALDWYWQSPEEYLSSRYVHFVLLDQSEPTEWYASQLYQRKVMREIEDPEYPLPALFP